MRHITWKQFSRYLFIQKGLSCANASSYKSQFSTITRFLKDKPFTLKSILQFLEYIEYTRNLSNASINNYIKTLRHVARYIKRPDIMDEISYKPKIRRLPKTLTVSEFKKILRTHPRRNYRIHCRHVNAILDCALSLGFYCGLRSSEVCHLVWDDVRNGHITIRNTKNYESRQIPVPTALYRRIIALPRRGPYVFSQRAPRPMHRETLAFEIKKRLAILGWEGRIDRFHDLRHSFGTLAASTDISLFKIQQYMGHKDIASTELYIHLSSKHLQEVVDRFPTHRMDYTTMTGYVHQFMDQMKSPRVKTSLRENDERLVLTIKKST